MRRRFAFVGVSVLAIMSAMSPSALSAPLDASFPTLPVGTALQRTTFADLPGWQDDRLGEVLGAFLASCRATIADHAALRSAQAPPPALAPICKAAVAREWKDDHAIRVFFETHFTPYRIVPAAGNGFLTAYFEPEVDGSLTRSEEFPIPLLGRPPDLKTFAPDEVRPESWDAALTAARRVTSHGQQERLDPYPDRAAIEAGALDGLGLERIFLKDAVDAFIIHVQGSTRVRLPDGRVVRMVYAGRNGHPYTSIGKIIVAEGHMDLETMTLQKLMGWLRAHPAEAQRIMRLNRSYIFFERKEDVPAGQGPIGGAGLPLTPHRSLAVDRSIWSYGLPFYVETDLPQQPGGPLQPVNRLMIAQDTGSAILGAARADYFMGSGAEAGIQAGLVRHAMHLTVFWPNIMAEPR